VQKVSKARRELRAKRASQERREKLVLKVNLAL
jgi:hypothetical protein